jgi:hypothetical protein
MNDLVYSMVGVIRTPDSSTAFERSMVAMIFEKSKKMLDSANVLPGHTLRPNPNTESTWRAATESIFPQNLSGLNCSGSGYKSSLLVMALYYIDIEIRGEQTGTETGAGWRRNEVIGIVHGPYVEHHRCIFRHVEPLVIVILH